MNFAKECEFSLLIPAHDFQTHPEVIRSTLCKCVEFLQKCYIHSNDKTFEIVLIPNLSKNSMGGDELLRLAYEISQPFPQVKIAFHSGPPYGKGAALTTGYQSASGNWIGFIDADLPFDLQFFHQAIEKIKSGYDFVTGNRRLAESVFRIPVPLLSLAYGRHRLGLIFNRIVRWCFSIRSTDTQSGIKLMTRKLAMAAFGLQACPGFFLDLELFLRCQGLGLRHTELPVVLSLYSEKTTVRIFREFFLALFWILRLKIRQIRGVYSDRKNPTGLSLLIRVPQQNLWTKVFLFLRWKLTPYRKLSQKLPHSGKILDLGCGHGLLSFLTALESSERQVLAIDHDLRRIESARVASRNIPNLNFKNVDFNWFYSHQEKWDAILAVDVLHYLTPELQYKFIEKTFASLNPGGVFLLRNVNTQNRLRLLSRWNKIYEKWATQLGFTKTEEKNLHFRPPADWSDLLKSFGYQVSIENCGHFLFSDILFVSNKHCG